MSSRTLLFTALCLFLLAKGAVIPMEFYQDTPKYFPSNTFDTIDSSDFQANASGSFKYSIATWFKISRTMTGTYAILLHLTSLAGVEYPWDSLHYASGVRHLSNLIRMRYWGNQMYIDVGSFTDAQNQYNANYNLNTNCWHFGYVGVNHETARMTVGLFSDGCQSDGRFISKSIGTAYSNEALDKRLTLYLGGSKNHVTGIDPTTESWPGSLYRTMFLIGFYTESSPTVKLLMGGERKNMYFFFLDNTVLQQKLQSYADPNTYITLGGDLTVESTDPTFNGVDGVHFVDASTQKMFVTLSTELQDYNFISFWVKIDSAPSSGQSNIISIRTASGTEFLSIMYKSTQRLTLRRGSAVISNDYAAAINTWHFVFLTFDYRFWDSSTNAAMVVNFIVNSVAVLTNQYLSDTLPSDILKPLAVLYFGGVTGAADPVVNGAVRNLIGGTGTYFVQDTTPSATCGLSIGLQTPFCLYCNPASSLYADPSGNCVSTCPVGTYQDSRSLTCVPCDATCSSCTGPGPTFCSACSEDTPIFFKNMCFSSCPRGTLKNMAGGCDCDPSCSNCAYNSGTQIAECAGCAVNTLFLLPDKSKCVPSTECPIGTLANTVTLGCSLPGSCPGGTVPDYANKKCNAYCPTNSVKVSTPSVQCYSKCPDGYYSTTNTPGVAGETTVGCTACTPPCLTCTSASDCLSCVPPSLFHEDIYKCATSCQDGFDFQIPGYFCKACRKNCQKCSSILSLYGDTCVDDCPLGTTKTSAPNSICQDSLSVDATILNKTASVTTIPISRKQNLVLVGKYASSSKIDYIQWSLDTTDTTLKSQFFNGVVTNNESLVIPSANLKENQLYKVTFEVKDKTPTTDLEFVQVQTSAAITPGTFKVSPSTGTAFQTEFTFTIADFPGAANLKYDIVSFFERSQTINGKTLIERVDTISIGLGVQQGTYTFIYPISQVQKPLTIELCAYNDYEQTCLKQSITLLPSGDLPLQKVLVWSADASTLKTLDRMLDFVRSISLFYARGWANQLSTEYSRGALLIENLVVTKNLIACNKIAECSNQGQCIFSGSSFTCQCELGLGGYNCYYGVREFDTVSIRVRDILTNLYSVKLDITNVEKAILILDELTNVLDLVEYNSIFFFRDILSNILQVPDLKRQHFRPIFSVLGEVIGFVKRSLTSTWFKAVDRSLLLISLTDLVDTAFGMIDGVRWPENYFLIDTNFLKVLVINDISGTFLGSSKTSDFTVEFGGFGYTFPKERIEMLPSASIKLLGYSINPYSDSQTNSQVTSVVKIEVFDVNGALVIKDLNNPITIKIPKLAATPVFQSKSGSNAFTCQYTNKSLRDKSKISFSSDGCSFVSESTTHVTCACKHLTEFVGQLNVDSLASVPTSAAISEVNNAFITQQLAIETAKRAYYTSTSTSTASVVTSQVTFVREFAFPNLGLYFAGAIIAMYLLVMLFNMGNVKKNALKKFLDQGQSILVLTYHPVFSMFIRAHTATSNTQLMRVTKFFCMLESYAGLTSLIFFLLDLEFSLTGGAKLVISSFLTLILGPGLSYFTEFVYRMMTNNKRNSLLYHVSHLAMMIIWGGVTVGLVGLIRSDYRITWMGSFILTTALDIVIFDLIVLIFAMMKKNNSKYLSFFKTRGYYIDTGAASIITPEDEAALISKIKKALRADNLRDMNSGLAPIFGGANKLVGDIEDMNASHVTDINNEDLKEIKSQPNQNDNVLPDLEGGEEEELDQEIPQLMQNIERESIRNPRSYNPKPVPTRMPATKGNKSKLKY